MKLIEITDRPALKFETLTGIHRVEIKCDEELAEEIYKFVLKKHSPDCGAEMRRRD